MYVPTVDCTDAIGFLVAEVEAETADGLRTLFGVLVLNVSSSDAIELEVSAEGVGGHGSAGVIDLVAAAEVKHGVVAIRTDAHRVEVTHEADHAVRAGGLIRVEISVADGDTSECWIAYVVIRLVTYIVLILRPLDNVGLASLNGRGILEVEVERAVGSIETRLVGVVCACDIQLHQR